MPPEQAEERISPALPEWALELPRRRTVCPICRGAGYLVKVASDGSSDRVPCRCKLRELQESDYQELQRLSNLEPFADKTFETFDPDVPGAAKAYRAARAYAENPSGWLFLTGNYGCGKTHLAAAIANEAVRRRILIRAAEDAPPGIPKRCLSPWSAGCPGRP